MGIVSYTLDPANPPRMTPEEEARLDAMTPEEIERNAIEDPDNPPWTEAEMERGRFGRRVRLAREATGLDRAAFAARYGLAPALVDDWEDGRFQPDQVAWAYVTVIARAPEAVAAALAA